MTLTRTALETAQEFIRAVEAKDYDAVEATLAPNARQLFMHSSRTTTEKGVADLVADRATGLCVRDPGDLHPTRQGTESVEDGSREVVRVALLGSDGPTGTFTLWDGETIPW